MEKRKRDWGKLAALLCAVLLALNLWQLRQLSDLRGELRSVESNLQMESRRLEGQVQAVQRDVKSGDQLVQRWDYAPSVNMDRHCLDVEISVVLKEWGEDSAAELLWYDENDGGGGGSVPLSGDGTGTFAGRLEIPLDGAGTDIGLGLMTRDGGVRRREELGLLGSVSELLPVRCDFQAGRIQAEYMKDVFTVYECGAELYTNSLETEGHVFRLRRNGDVAAEQAAEPGDRLDSYFCGRLSTEVGPGDEMALTFFCRDENGLGYEFLLQSWVAVEERDVALGSPEWTSWPRLTWD